MAPKREKRPKRLAWFAMDVDAFLDDPRMQNLTNQEKSAWALMLIRSFRNQGKMIVEPAIVTEQTGLSHNTAKHLLAKLYRSGLIVPTEHNDDIFDGQSNRMVKEFEIAQATYDRFSELGNKSAEVNGNKNLKLIKK